MATKGFNKSAAPSASASASHNSKQPSASANGNNPRLSKVIQKVAAETVQSDFNTALSPNEEQKKGNKSSALSLPHGSKKHDAVSKNETETKSAVDAKKCTRSLAVSVHVPESGKFRVGSRKSRVSTSEPAVSASNSKFSREITNDEYDDLLASDEESD